MESDEKDKHMFVFLLEEENAAATDCTCMIGFSSLQKCTVAMRLLAYGAPGDSVDDYLCMAESTAIDFLYKFCRAVIAVFGEVYLRSPTAKDTEQILATMQQEDFLRCLKASTACIASGRTVQGLAGQKRACTATQFQVYKGHKGGCSVVLEVVVTCDTRIWHSFFGMAESNNFINILQCSH
ncbi:uncharacterized protein [Lolium perenne]|jgi:hypothetical protein|uniref:uncharacterized protein n=1 Tax=Lolium perenne TaxID=4522 RepID=UPI0021F6054E|nr:uncharacterized protein LOC127303958 [Lolium perenne]